MASITNAGKIWQLLHQNDDFASTLLLGVSNDDTDKVQSALDIVNIDPNDLNLTDQEIENFLRGVTASGALELTSWEGYYVTEPLSGSGDKYALLILSLDNTVYWGPESKLIRGALIACMLCTLGKYIRVLYLQQVSSCAVS